MLEVTEASDPDLFWALRGGGGNFGIATALTYRLHPLEMVTGGLIAHPIEAAPELLRFYRDAVARLSRRADRLRRPRACPRRVGHEDVGPGGVSHGDRGAGRAGPGAVQDLGLAADGRGRANALSGDEHAPGRRLSGWLAELLAVELHARSPRRADRRDGRALRLGAVADVRDPAGAVPRRRDARGRSRYRCTSPRGGLEPRPPVRVARIPRQRTRTSPGRARPTCLRAASRRGPMAELPR